MFKRLCLPIEFLRCAERVWLTECSFYDESKSSVPVYLLKKVLKGLKLDLVNWRSQNVLEYYFLLTCGYKFRLIRYSFSVFMTMTIMRALACLAKSSSCQSHFHSACFGVTGQSSESAASVSTAVKCVLYWTDAAHSRFFLLLLRNKHTKRTKWLQTATIYSKHFLR